jgi:hypothetical protein
MSNEREQKAVPTVRFNDILREKEAEFYHRYSTKNFFSEF